MFRIIHRKLKFGGDIWGGFVPYYIPEGGCVLRFVIVTYDFIYLINLIGQK